MVRRGGPCPFKIRKARMMSVNLDSPAAMLPLYLSNRASGAWILGFPEQGLSFLPNNWNRLPLYGVSMSGRRSDYA